MIFLKSPGGRARAHFEPLDPTSGLCTQWYLFVLSVGTSVKLCFENTHPPFCNYMFSMLLVEYHTISRISLPRWHSGKESACQCRRPKRQGLGRCPGVGNGNPLQYSCLENSMDRGAWLSTVHGFDNMTAHTHDISRKQPSTRCLF